MLIIILTLCAVAAAQGLPRIAVYVTGNVGEDEKKALGTRMLASLVNSGRYKGIERSKSFLAEIEKEQVKQRSGEIDDSQISALGKQFGVKFVCIADITSVLGAFQISARIVDVETAEVAFIGESYSALKNVIDLVSVCDQVVKNMFGGDAAIRKPTPGPERNPAPKSELQPKPVAQEPPPAAVSPAAVDPQKQKTAQKTAGKPAVAEKAAESPPKRETAEPQKQNVAKQEQPRWEYDPKAESKTRGDIDPLKNKERKGASNLFKELEPEVEKTAEPQPKQTAAEPQKQTAARQEQPRWEYDPKAESKSRGDIDPVKNKDRKGVSNLFKELEPEIDKKQ